MPPRYLPVIPNCIPHSCPCILCASPLQNTTPCSVLQQDGTCACHLRHFWHWCGQTPVWVQTRSLIMIRADQFTSGSDKAWASSQSPSQEAPGPKLCSPWSKPTARSASTSHFGEGHSVQVPRPVHRAPCQGGEVLHVTTQEVWYRWFHKGVLSCNLCHHQMC